MPQPLRSRARSFPVPKVSRQAPELDRGRAQGEGSGSRGSRGCGSQRADSVRGGRREGASQRFLLAEDLQDARPVTDTQSVRGWSYEKNLRFDIFTYKSVRVVGQEQPIIYTLNFDFMILCGFSRIRFIFLRPHFYLYDLFFFGCQVGVFLRRTNDIPVFPVFK